MGKLAFWGAVAGGAKGYQTELANREKREAAAIDEARQMRLEKMKEAHSEKLQTSRQTHETEMQATRGAQALGQIEATGEQRLNAVNAEMGGREKLQEDQQLWKTSENELDRASREKIAGAKNSAAAINASKQFEPKILTVSEAGQFGVPIEKDTPAIYDNVNAKWYLQEGDRLVAPGAEPPAGRAPDAALKALYKHPEKANIFFSEYNYLPAGFLGLMRRAQLSGAEKSAANK